jgi:prevent-host-death family protein
MARQKHISRKGRSSIDGSPIPEDILQLSNVRFDLSEIIIQVANGMRRVIIEKYGRPRVVVISVNDYERYRRLEESLAVEKVEQIAYLEQQYAANLHRLEVEREAIRQKLRQELPGELDRLKQLIEKMQQDVRKLPIPD